MLQALTSIGLLERKIGGCWLTGGLLTGPPGTRRLTKVARGRNYGDMILRSGRTGGATANICVHRGWRAIHRSTSAADLYHTTRTELGIWSTLIHGARGIVYFNHTFGGPDMSDNNLAHHTIRRFSRDRLFQYIPRCKILTR